MVKICLYFQVHKPFALQNFKIFDIGQSKNYIDFEKSETHIKKVAYNSYLKANQILLKLIKKYPQKFHISFSLSGTALELMEKYTPEVLESFKQLSQTNNVEFLSETYYHSLSFLYSKKEFQRQIELHTKAIQKHFNQTPKTFRNSELIYTNDLANFIENLGYNAILAEVPYIYLNSKSPNNLYQPHTTNQKITLLTRNDKLSDDISLKFSNKEWDEYPLTANKYAQWIKSLNTKENNIINLFLNYETFGEKHDETTNIFKFLEEFPQEIIKHNINFITPSQAIKSIPKKEKIEVPFTVSWSDEKDITMWLGNKMQQNAAQEIFALEKTIKKLKSKEILIEWRHLTSSDHFYEMSTKYIGTQNPNFNQPQQDSPYNAYVQYMNILNDLIVKIQTKQQLIKTQKEILKNPKGNILSQIKKAIQQN